MNTTFMIVPSNFVLQQTGGAFAGCVINNGGNYPNQTEIHCDVSSIQIQLHYILRELPTGGTYLPRHQKDHRDGH